MEVSAYVEERIRRAPPPNGHVTPHSTPVVAFGDFLNARVATLGLNPSQREFQGPDGNLLDGPSHQRLATLKSLAVQNLAGAPSSSIAAVQQACLAYFQVNPYWGWFKRLEPFCEAFGASYRDGSACHLDLVQWATSPVWGKLPDLARRKLIAEDSSFLARQLSAEHIEVLLVNGSGAWFGLRDAFQADLEMRELEPIKGHSAQTCRLWVGTYRSKVRVAAWSTNVQSSRGVKGSFPEAVRSALREHL